VARTIAALDRSFGELDLEGLIPQLSQQVATVQSGDLGTAEEMLTAQAYTLDMLFHKLVMRSMQNIKEGYGEAGDAYMRLALRAQSQARATLETLSVVKNPPAGVFVRQANIAHGHQQVNNGASPSPSARGERPGLAKQTFGRSAWRTVGPRNGAGDRPS
jgi:hypothetical protein